MPPSATLTHFSHTGTRWHTLSPHTRRKSTTLRLITGLAMPSQGQVLLRGHARTQSLASLVEYGRKSTPPDPPPPRIAMVFQNAALFDSLTIRQNIGFPLTKKTSLPAATVDAHVRTWMARVGLDDDILDRLPEELSGGMRKRASFARAVIFDPDNINTAPDIVCYDEPTAGLDSVSSTRIENVIVDLRQYCPTSVVVTHQFSTIRRTADRVVFLHDGVAVWQGSVSQLDTTDNPYVQQFMSSSLDGPLRTVDDQLLPGAPAPADR